MGRPEIERRTGAWSIIPAFALPALGFLVFTSSGRDDAYITYWAARSLARTGDITNYNGARLEQSSSLLQTAVLAALNKVTTVAIPTIGVWLGILAATATALLAARIAERIAPGAGVTAGLLTAISPFLVYWAFGGLEAPIVALLMLAIAGVTATAIIEPSARSLLKLAGVTACFVTVRPEGGLVLVCVGLAAVLLAVSPFAPAAPERRPWRGAVLVLLLAVVASLLLAGWRLWYFGKAQPQTVTAKVGGVRVGDGIHYVWLWWGHWWMLPILAAAAAGAVGVIRRRSWLSTMVVLLLTSYCGFVVLAGGDWMEVGRFLVPVAPLVAVLTAVALRQVPRRHVRRVLAAAVVITQLIGISWVASDWSTGRPVWAHLSARLPVADVAKAEASPWYEQGNRVHYRDLAFIGHLRNLVDAVGTRSRIVTVASGQAGMIPYYLMQNTAARVVFIDRGSLTTDTFHRCSHALTRSSLGAAMSFDYWLAHTAECGVPAPDVVYGVGLFTSVTGLAGQYRLVYQQPDVPIAPESDHLRGPATSAAQFIAVRNDLLPLPPIP